MLTSLKRSLVLLLVLIGSQSSANSNKTNEVPGIYTDPQKVIMVDAASPQFTLKLKSTGSTGYSWFLQRYDSHLVTPIQRIYQAPQKTLPGAGSSELWIFRLTPAALQVPHVTRLQLVYARPWELEYGTIIKFTVITSAK